VGELQVLGIPVKFMSMMFHLVKARQRLPQLAHLALDRFAPTMYPFPVWAFRWVGFLPAQFLGGGRSIIS